MVEVCLTSLIVDNVVQPMTCDLISLLLHEVCINSSYVLAVIRINVKKTSVEDTVTVTLENGQGKPRTSPSQLWHADIILTYFPREYSLACKAA